MSNKFVRGACLAALVCVSSLAYSAPQVSAPKAAVSKMDALQLDAVIPVGPQVKVGKLANGLTYYIQRNARPEHKLELRLVVKAGSILEDDDQRGLAHFV